MSSLEPNKPAETRLADVCSYGFDEFNPVLGTWMAINPFVIEKYALQSARVTRSSQLTCVHAPLGCSRQTKGELATWSVDLFVQPSQAVLYCSKPACLHAHQAP